MNIDIIPVGYLQENCYILSKDNNCLLIDPGDEADKIIKEIGNKNVCGILITHYHFDHIGALPKLKEIYKTKIYDYRNIGQTINVGDFSFEIIDTKGHTKDSVSFYFKKNKVMFTGDFLFKESIGRCDFDESDESLMKQSIIKIKKYDKNIDIYPGHGDKTTLEYEFNNNYFLK